MEALHDMENNKGIITRSFKAAFPCTIPILAGFLFLGMAYGIYMNVSGFSFVYPMIMAAVISAAVWSSSRRRCCFRRSRRSRC